MDFYRNRPLMACPSRGCAAEQSTDCGDEMHHQQKACDRSSQSDTQMHRMQECGCQKQSTDALAGLPLVMAYVPMQRWGQTYDLCDALIRGTLFPELDLPFLAMGGVCR